MIEIVKFDHISMAVPELDPQVDLLCRLFGFRWEQNFDSHEGYAGANLRVPGNAGVTWEVIAPNSERSYLHRFLGEGGPGPGLHHLAIQVRSVEQAVEAMRAEGIEPWGLDDRGDGGPGGQVYLHPSSGGNGFLYQLYAGEPWNDPEPFTDDDEQTLGIIDMNHLAHAHVDRDEIATWYERVLGCETIYRSPDEPERGFQTRVVESPSRQLRFEMIEPAGEDSFMQRFLDRRGGPSIHHATFEVGDWERAIEACAYHEVPVFGEQSGETDGVPWREAFIHPKHTGGMLTQFFWQAQPGVWI